MKSAYLVDLRIIADGFLCFVKITFYNLIYLPSVHIQVLTQEW